MTKMTMMTTTTTSFLLWLALGAVGSSIAAAAPPDPLVGWLRSMPSGFFSDKIAWKNLEDPSSDGGGNYAMFASEDVPKGETLIVVPHSALITSKGSEKNCDTVKTLLEELEKGEESDFFPYIDYLFGDGTKRGKVPSSWSEEGQHLLELVIGDSLFPERIDHHNVEDFCSKEISSEDPTQIEQDAYLFMISRSWDDVMIPVYDMINHRNGKWRNVEANSAHLENDIRVFAYRDIKAGEQLYMSYSECDDEDCEAGMKYKYITPTILTDYGFVEQYPRRFFIEEERKLVVEVDVDETTGEKFLEWPLGRFPDGDQVNYMVGQLKRLYDLDEVLDGALPDLESDHERDVIAEWHAAYKEVLELAVAYREGGRRPPPGSTKGKQYDPLVQGQGLGVEGVNIEVCWENPSERDADSWDSTKSQYQEIEFTYNEKKDNSCLYLSGWLQTCTDFRPHYHEAFVHVPAQYVEDVKRVAFLGGGDNMILHEILKYPNLELVVGMELDQQVIRSAFKNLGTLPYFDDPRVNWWFGDATKSLLAVPESYYDSFDLVLVDLQTFVADALKVTDKLTIMETAILLMKQDGGVIAKNEDFNVRTNVGFAKYTVDLEYHDLPQICQQSITMGSNSIDFVTAETTAHGVDVLAIDLPGGEDFDPYDAWYSYRQTVRDTCSAAYDDDDENASSSSPGEEEECDPSGPKSKEPMGILLVLEAENVGRSLESMDEVKEMIRKSVKDAGFTEDSISGAATDEDAFFFVMREGYVTVRVFADEKHVAFDVMLWDGLDLIDDLSEALIEAVGGDSRKSASSFRFVTGGMSGLETCRKDVLGRVASETEALLCRDAEAGAAALAGSDDEAATSGVLRNLLASLTPRRGGEEDDPSSSRIAVFCGEEGSACPSLETARNLGGDSRRLDVVPIYACASFDEMELCEKETYEKLRAFVSGGGKKLDALVVDTSLPFEMGQIVESIFTDPVVHYNIMERTHLVLSQVVEEEAWRDVLVDIFRTDIVIFDEAYRADLRFFKKTESSGKKKEGSLDWRVFSGRDPDFFNRLSSTISIIEEDAGLEAEVREIANGVVTYVADFSPSKEFTDGEYDKTRSRAQWNSQTPVGHQTLFSFNVQPPKVRLAAGERVLAEHEPGPWDMQYGGAVVERYLGDETYLVYYDGDDDPEPVDRNQIRKFSESDADLSTSFEVGDLIFYRGRNQHVHQNGVISRVDEGGTYSIYLLNPSGTKLYDVERNQLLHQFETADFYREVQDLSVPIVRDAFENAIEATWEGGVEVSSEEDVVLIGSGAVMTAFWSEGHAILKWDGAKRVDVNVFTREEDPKSRIAFQEAFADNVEHMKSATRDEHPRGHGSVVNFPSEMKKPPHWV